MKWIKPYKLFETEENRWWGYMYHDPYGDGYRLMMMFNTLFNPIGITLHLDACSEGVQLCFKVNMNYMWPCTNPIFKTIFEAIDPKIKTAYPVVGGKTFASFHIDFYQNKKEYVGMHTLNRDNTASEETRRYRHLMPDTEEETLVSIIRTLYTVYREISTEVSLRNRTGGHIKSPLSGVGERTEFPMTKNVILKYTSYLLNNPPSIDKESIRQGIGQPPNELYKILLPELEFNILNKIEGTELYNELKKIGGDKFDVASDMGSLGFENNKWIKKYDTFNEAKWYEPGPYKGMHSSNDNYPAFKLIRTFNLLFNPLGFFISTEKNTNDKILLSFKIDINFALDDRINNVFRPLLLVMKPELETKYAYPNFQNGRNATTILIEFYKENARLGDILDRGQSGNTETRKFKHHILSLYTTEEQALAYVINCISNVFNSISVELTYADSLSMPKREVMPLFKNVVTNYTKFLLDNANPQKYSNFMLNGSISVLDITEPPKELYKYVITEIGNYPDHFKLIKLLKDTPLYSKLKAAGNIDALTTGEQMGDLGF